MIEPFWIAFGDIHDDLTRLRDIPDVEKAAGVILNGDLTLGGGVKQAERVLTAVRKRTLVCYAQIGNMDRPEITEAPRRSRLSAHRRSSRNPVWRNGWNKA